MYERSAIVLERYLNKKFGLDQKINLKENYNNYCNIIKEVKEYQEIVQEEEGLIEKFDEVAKEIQDIQSKQAKLYESNKKMEEMRNQLFSDLGENPEVLESKLKKVEQRLDENNEELKKLGEAFVKSLTIFSERQKERNKCARKKRVVEANHISYIKDEKEFCEQINMEYIKNMKDFLDYDTSEAIEELNQIMMKNGKNEKVAFHKDVIQKAIMARIEIAQKEVECYLSVYEKSRKLLAEIDNEDIKLSRYEKIARDVSVKLAFLEAEKDYIVGFLDNERLTAINGPKQHKAMMDDACKGFDSDMIQIHNLYQLLLRETVGKSTKKAYKELYNKTYLKEIEEKEKNFEQEVNHIKIRMGTVINSNYWRIEGIKNIYDVFQKEITEKFEKDLSEFQIEETEEIEEIEISETPEAIGIEQEERADRLEKELIKMFDSEDEKYDDDEEDEYELDIDDEYDDDEDEYEYEDDDEEDYDDEFDEESDEEDEYELDDDDEKIEERLEKETKKVKVYKQVRGRKMTAKKESKNKKGKKKTSQSESKKASKKENKKEPKKESKKGRKKADREIIIEEEQEEIPKAMKKLKQEAEKERKNKVDVIIQNTRKKQVQELAKKQDTEKKLFSIFFKK